MHLPTFLQGFILVSLTTASLLPPSSSTNLSPPASAFPSAFISAPASIDKPNLNPRLSWDDIVKGAKSLYSQAMATPTTIEHPPNPSETAALHGDVEAGDEYSNNTQFKGGKGGGSSSNNGCPSCSSKNGSNILDRPGLLTGVGVGLVVLGLFA